MPDLFIPRLARLAVLTALLAGTLLAVVPNAEAGESKSCAEQVVADWYGDLRVDKIYPLPCYRAAIRSLPVDVLDYSQAAEDILRALQFARKGKPDPGPSGGPSPNGEDPTTPDDPPDTTSDDPPGTTGTGPGSGPDGDTGAVDDGLDTSGPSSIPLPLFILGGLALLLLAAGAAGYVSRRAQGRRPGGPPAT